MSDVQFRFRDDEPVGDPGVTVDAFSEQSNATAVRLEPGDEARDLLPHLDRLRLIEVNFPVFGDGRGYSSARILREAGYTGETRIERIHVRSCKACGGVDPVNAAGSFSHTAWPRWACGHRWWADRLRRSGAMRLRRPPDRLAPLGQRHRTRSAA